MVISSYAMADGTSTQAATKEGGSQFALNFMYLIIWSLDAWTSRLVRNGHVRLAWRRREACVFMTGKSA